MKKTIAILLVAIMAVGSAFAAFSGSAQVGVGANFDNGDWGFIGNETKITFDVDLATMNAEDVSEGDIYASIKGSLGLRLVSDQDGIGTGNPLAWDGNFVNAFYGTIDEAKIAGANWYVSLKGVADVNDFAKSAIDTWTAKNDYDEETDGDYFLSNRHKRMNLYAVKALLAKRLKFLLKALTSLPNVSSAEVMPTPPRLTAVYSSPVTVKSQRQEILSRCV